MKKKYVIMLIVSLILIVAEAVCFVIFAFPYVKVDMIHRAVKNGDGQRVAALSENLNGKVKDLTMEMLTDYSSYLSDQYLDGKLSFDDVEKQFIAMGESTGRYDVIIMKYNSIVLGEEAIKVADKAYPEYVSDPESPKLEEFKQEYMKYVNFSTISSLEVEKYIYNYISLMYSDYKENIVDFNTVHIYAKLLKVLSSDCSAPFYADVAELANTLDLIEGYEADIVQINTYIAEQNYIDAVTYADTVIGLMQNDTTGYIEQIKKLRVDSYEAGKTYYLEYIRDLVKKNEYEAANALVPKLEILYGEDIDMTTIKELVKEPWKKAYAAFMEKWDSNLASDMKSNINATTFDVAANVDYSSNKPDKVFLHDFDGDGIPELMLASSGTTKYQYIYTYVGNEMKFLGVLCIVNLTNDGRIVSQIITPGSGMAGYEVLKYKAGAFEIDTYYIKANDNSKFIVNGEETDAKKLEAKYEEIKALAEEKDNQISYGTYMDSALQLIDQYTKGQ